MSVGKPNICSLGMMSNIRVCLETPWLLHVLGKLRDERTNRADFRKYSELIGDYLVMEAFNSGFIPIETGLRINTPTGRFIDSGVALRRPESIMAVSVVRAGNAFINSVTRLISSDLQVGQLVIQRDEETALPKTLLKKLPRDISSADCVIVLDPMLATGGSIIAAVDVLIAYGVSVDRIVLLHAFGCPEGIAAVQAAFPGIKAVVAVKDSHLNERKYIIPGLGDFGDRFYCD